MAREGHASRSLVAGSTSYPFAFLEVVESSGPSSIGAQRSQLRLWIK
jgi:hypothetical protein